METFSCGIRIQKVSDMNKQSEEQLNDGRRNDVGNASGGILEQIATEQKPVLKMPLTVGGAARTFSSAGISVVPNKFIIKGQPLHLLTQDKTTVRTKHVIAKPITPTHGVLPSNAITINASGPSKIQNNLTLSPVKGGFKIPISPMKNFKNPVRLSFVSSSNASTSTNNDSSFSGNSRLDPQNTSNFQFQTLVSPQTNRITVNNPPTISQPINLQQQLPGGRYQCLRLVPASGSQQTTPPGIPISNLIPTQPIATPVRTAIVQQQQQQQQPHLAQPFVNVSTVQKPLGQPPAKAQRLIMPATTNQPTQQLAGSNLSPGSVLQAGNVGYAMLPAKYVEQLKKQLDSQHLQAIKTETIISDSTNASANAVAKSGANGKIRKPCNCTKSMCLKLYCECFANGHFCDSCNCINCHNNIEFDSDRSKAIKSCLERNPLAFKPKIGRGGDDNRTHQKGCNCKRSGCLKNYCECYEARIPCTSKCKCIGCKNIEEDGASGSEQRSLMNLADAAAVRCQQQAAARSRINSQMKDMRSSRAKSSQTATGERLPCMFFTQEVVEATCTCMLAQAEEAEKTSRSIQVAETMILEEFGRCLMQIIQAAGKTKPTTQSL